jgi:Kef-type K+ transport system membrane component KefB
MLSFPLSHAVCLYSILSIYNPRCSPVGQLIISAAVIDDMIALVVLSQLEALSGELTVTSILLPVLSASLFLILGGYIAIFVLPPLINKHVLSRVKEQNQGRVEMGIMIALLIVMMPATYYSKASYLMGAFLAGLTFCTSHQLHHTFVRQFKRVLQWLMRIFFAASIGFQVPIKDFGKGEVVWQGLVFTLALLGKLGVGFMVPNFTQSRKFTGNHLRDCLITGFSMAAEGEFAFVIAVFAVEDGLISKDLYASVVLAVLLSTIIPPFLLRFTINHYNKQAEALVQQAALAELARKHDLDSHSVGPSKGQTAASGSGDDEASTRQDELVAGIKNQTTVFLCIQTQSESKWGLLHGLMNCMARVRCFELDEQSKATDVNNRSRILTFSLSSI